MERHKALKRGEPLKSDPAKTRAWKERTAARLPRASKQRRADEKTRKAFREFVLKHRPVCEARLPWCCKHVSTEVNELQRGSGREDCWLDYEKVTALCHDCHAWITVHGEWARHHGHQVQVGRVEEERAFAIALSLRNAALYVFPAVGSLRHWPTYSECEIDHRDERTA